MVPNVARFATTAASRLGALLRRLRRRADGNAAMTMAIAFPALLAATGGALDYANVTSRRASLQHAADGSALAGASEFRIGTATVPMISQVVRNFVSASLGGAGATATVT